MKRTNDAWKMLMGFMFTNYTYFTKIRPLPSVPPHFTELYRRKPFISFANFLKTVASSFYNITNTAVFNYQSKW